MRKLAGAVVLAAATGCSLLPNSPTPQGPSHVAVTPVKPVIGAPFTLALKSLPLGPVVPDGTYSVFFVRLKEASFWEALLPAPPALKTLPPAEPHISATLVVSEGSGSVQIPLAVTLQDKWGTSFPVTPGGRVGMDIRGEEFSTAYDFFVSDK